LEDERELIYRKLCKRTNYFFFRVKNWTKRWRQHCHELWTSDSEQRIQKSTSSSLSLAPSTSCKQRKHHNGTANHKAQDTSWVNRNNLLAANKNQQELEDNNGLKWLKKLDVITHANLLTLINGYSIAEIQTCCSNAKQSLFTSSP